jgi:GntR family transcriptional regulator
MHQRGCVPGTRVLSLELVTAKGEMAENLQVPEGEELAHVQRLRLADEEPVSVEDSYMVHRYCQGILNHDFATKSMRQMLDLDFGIRLIRAKQIIRAVQATPVLARVLSIRTGCALLYIERVSFSQYDVPVEFLKINYRGDRYTLYNELQG